MLERSAVAALNHLLSQNDSAAARLRGFAGQSVEVRCPPFPELRLRITGEGMLERAPCLLVVVSAKQVRPGSHLALYSAPDHEDGAEYDEGPPRGDAPDTPLPVERRQQRGQSGLPDRPRDRRRARRGMAMEVGAAFSFAGERSRARRGPRLYELGDGAHELQLLREALGKEKADP